MSTAQEHMRVDALHLAVICQANKAEERDSCVDGACPKHHSRTINSFIGTDEEHVAPNINTENY